MLTQDAAALTARVQDGSYDLLLETSDPGHALVHAYNALHVWGQLRAALRTAVKKLHITLPGTTRSSIISEQASNRVLDAVQRFFKLPS